MREQAEHRAAEKSTVGARVGDVGIEILLAPRIGAEVLFEDVVINLAVTTELGAVHSLGQCGQRVAREFQPAFACGRRHVVQLVIVAMIAQRRGGAGALLKPRVELFAKKRFELGVLGIGGGYIREREAQCNTATEISEQTFHGCGARC